MSATLRIGPLTLRGPDGYELWSSRGEGAAQIERFVAASPDHTLYHSLPYRELAHRLKFAPDTIVGLARGGELVLALPVMPETAFRFTTSYAGAVFAPGDKALKRAGAALERLIDA